MKKQKSHRETKFMRQTGVWLPHSTYDELKRTAGERGLGGEIRRRLEISLKADQALHDQTDDLINAIKWIEQKIPSDERWHSDRFVFKVFKAAIDDLLLDYQPKSDERTETMAEFKARYGNNATAESIGQILAHAAPMARDKKE